MSTHDEFITRFAERLHRDSEAPPLTAMFLRTRSIEGRDLMARGATAGGLDAAGLVAFARRTLDPDHPGSPDDAGIALDPSWLLGTAQLFALQGGGNDDKRDALALLDLVHDARGPEPFDATSADLYAQLLMRAGRLDRLATVMPGLDLTARARWSLDLDLVNPFTTGAPAGTPAGAPADAWLEGLNQAFVPRGLEPVHLDGQAELPFDRLTAEATSYFDDELVTVVMSAFRPTSSIFMAVGSVLAQSWRNLELLVVDDASGPEYRGTFDQVAAMDERVTVLTMPVNGGTYLVRNFALDHARGEFVTFQDFDDWSHPRRLEQQVWALRAGKDVLATRCWSARAFPDLTFTFPGYPPDRVAASSFLFRRRPVLDLIGYFDTVRKSADIEYSSRLRAAAPGSLLDLRTGPPLMIYQIRHDSLSRGDAVPGWLRWTRIAYRDAYTHWHRKIRSGAAQARQQPGPDQQLAARPIPLPEPSWAGRPVAADPSPDYDVVYVHDWRKGQGRLSTQVTELKLMIEGGLRVALAHAETVLPPAERRQHLAPAIQDLVNSGAVDLVHVGQALEPSLVVVGDPSVLQFPPSATPAVKAERVVVVVDHGADDTPEAVAEPPYFLPDCAFNAVDLFGRRPRWLPRHPWARRFVAEQLDDADELLPFDLPAPVDAAALRTSRRRPGRGRPVIGRWSADQRDDWPATGKDLLAAYPDNDRFDVRIAGSSRPVLELLQRPHLPPNWMQVPESGVSPRSFLAQLDFLVYFPRADAALSAPHAALEAMAAGCVVVVPPGFAPVFGDAAVCCTPAEVPKVVRSLHTSPAAYREQQERGHAYVEHTHGARGYVELLRRVLDR